MHKFIVVLTIALLFSCGSEEDIITIHKNQINPQKHFWICYNPQSEFHGKECDDELEPGQCLEAGNSSKFCWELSASECFNSFDLPYNEVCSRF